MAEKTTYPLTDSRIIVVEGIDRVGKDLQARVLAEKLRGRYMQTPDYGSASGALLSHFVRGEAALVGPRFGLEYNAMAFQCAAIADRYAVASRALACSRAGVFAVVSRWWQSSVIYGSDDGVDALWTRAASSLLPEVGLQILLDSDPPGRRDTQPEDLGRVHRYDGERQRKIRTAYRNMWSEGGRLASPEWALVDASGSAGEVHQRVWGAVLARWPDELRGVSP